MKIVLGAHSQATHQHAIDLLSRMQFAEPEVTAVSAAEPIYSVPVTMSGDSQLPPRKRAARCISAGSSASGGLDSSQP